MKYKSVACSLVLGLGAYAVVDPIGNIESKIVAECVPNSIGEKYVIPQDQFNNFREIPPIIEGSEVSITRKNIATVTDSLGREITVRYDGSLGFDRYIIDGNDYKCIIRSLSS